MIKLFFLLSIILSTSLTYGQGHDKGNGGIVITCGNSIRLADFYEVEVLPGLNKMKINYSEDEVDHQILMALKKLASVNVTNPDKFYNELVLEYKNLKEQLNWLDGEFEWAFTDDLGRFPLRKECSPSNVIHYFSDDYADAQSTLFNRLSKTEQAGLYVHEIIYKLSRERSKQTNSLAARRITSLLFSNSNDLELLKGLYLMFLADGENHLINIKTGDNLNLNLNLSITGYKGIHTLNVDVAYSGKKLGRTQNKETSFTLDLSDPRKVQTIEISAHLQGFSGTMSVSYDLIILENTSEKYRTHITDKTQAPKGYGMTKKTFYLLPRSVNNYLYGKIDVDS